MCVTLTISAAVALSARMACSGKQEATDDYTLLLGQYEGAIKSNSSRTVYTLQFKSPDPAHIVSISDFLINF